MSPEPPPRRAHAKSRNGCSNCKRRKVKCGEEHPSCRNCTRRQEECSFVDDPVVLPTSAANGATASTTYSPTRCSSSDQTTITLPLSRVLPSGDLGAGFAGITNLTVLDLELLHHYSVSTYLTLSGDPVTRNYFLVGVPQLGFSHPYVLYSVLALAASHLAHFRPESRQYYYAQSKARHNMATSMAAPILSNISTTNVIPMHSFSIMTLFIAFANLRDEEDDSNDFLPSWLPLFRGVRTVLQSNNGAIFTSPISYLFYSVKVNEIWRTKISDVEALIDFQAYIEESTPEDDPTRELMLNALKDLRRAFVVYYGEELGNEAKAKAFFTWLYKIPDEFLALLRNRNSKALCILAFCCVLLHRLEFHWWFQGWGIHLIDRIYTTLDEVHRFWIRWPIQQIGWIPRRESLYHSTPSSA